MKCLLLIALSLFIFGFNLNAAKPANAGKPNKQETVQNRSDEHHSDSEAVKPKEKKEKKEIDPNKPKKTSGYLLYSADVRQQVKAKLIEDGGEGKPKEVVQAIAAKWKQLKDEEKAVWNDKAKAIKEPIDAN